MNGLYRTNQDAITLIRRGQYADAIKKLIEGLRTLYAALDASFDKGMTWPQLPRDSFLPLHSVSIEDEMTLAEEVAMFRRAYQFGSSSNEYSISASLLFNCALVYQINGGDACLKKAISLYMKVIEISETSQSSLNGMLMAVYCNMAKIHKIQKAQGPFLMARNQFLQLYNDNSLSSLSTEDASYFHKQAMELASDDLIAATSA